MQGDFILHIKLYIGVSSTMGPFGHVEKKIITLKDTFCIVTNHLLLLAMCSVIFF